MRFTAVDRAPASSLQTFSNGSLEGKFWGLRAETDGNCFAPGAIRNNWWKGTKRPVTYVVNCFAVYGFKHRLAGNQVSISRTMHIGVPDAREIMLNIMLLIAPATIFRTPGRSLKFKFNKTHITHLRQSDVQLTLLLLRCYAADLRLSSFSLLRTKVNKWNLVNWVGFESPHLLLGYSREHFY